MLRKEVVDRTAAADRAPTYKRLDTSAGEQLFDPFAVRTRLRCISGLPRAFRASRTNLLCAAGRAVPGALR